MRISYLWWTRCTLTYVITPKYYLSQISRRSVSSINARRIESKLVTMKVDSPHFKAILTPEINILSQLFQKYGYSLRVAGGAVRDLLLQNHPEDIDFATTATPEEMKEMFTAEGVRMFNRKGEGHGTVTVRINEQQNFEITTLRIDMHTDGRHAEVEFTKDWELDAGRRDLTINAMFLGLDGTLYDYFNGREDLEKRHVKFVGDPESRIQEDYLRILRYFRFYGKIAVEPDNHDAHTLEAIRYNVDGLSKISGERIWMELKKILAGNFSKELTLRMIDLGIGPFIGLPNDPNILEFEDVCNRSYDLNPHPMTYLASLLRTEVELMNLHSRLKLSKYDKELALFIIKNKEDKNGSPPLLPYMLLILESRNKPSDSYEWACEVLKYRGDAHLWKELSEWTIPKFPVNGHILMERGFKQGPKLTKIIAQLRYKWIQSNFKMSKDELLNYLDCDSNR